ncbi:MAG: hypothetical protein WC130_11180 [Kiritimatiellia bacterium]|jgi:hypothetical protein
MSVVAFAISILFLIAAWSAAQKTALDTTRDHLFDLRDEVRSYFLALPNGLNHPLYRELRDHLNRYIRFTERMHFLRILLFITRLPSHLVEEINRQLETKYSVNDPALRDYTLTIRSRSAVVMQKYMLMTSTTVMIMSAVLLPYILAKAMQGGIRLALVAGKHKLKNIMDSKKSLNPKTLEIVAYYESPIKAVA